MKGRHTLLVVDDEPDVVKSVQDLLRMRYRVLGATRAVEGLKIMEREDVRRDSRNRSRRPGKMDW